MKHHEFTTCGQAPRVGVGYLKVLGSGEIVKWKTFSDITQLYEVESVQGRRFTLQSNRVTELVSPEEAEAFERQRSGVKS